MTLGIGKNWHGLFLSACKGRSVGIRWRVHSKGKAHCKKLKQEWWFQLGDSMQRKNGATSQHCVRHSKSRPGVLGILQYAKHVREIIPVCRVHQRNN